MFAIKKYNTELFVDDLSPFLSVALVGRLSSTHPQFGSVTYREAVSERLLTELAKLDFLGRTKIDSIKKPGFFKKPGFCEGFRET